MVHYARTYAEIKTHEVDSRCALPLPQNPLVNIETDNNRPEEDKASPPAQAQNEHVSAEKVLDSDLKFMKMKKNHIILSPPLD